MRRLITSFTAFYGSNPLHLGADDVGAGRVCRDCARPASPVELQGVVAVNRGLVPRRCRRSRLVLFPLYALADRSSRLPLPR